MEGVQNKTLYYSILLFALIYALPSNRLYSQVIIKGTVSDSLGEPIPYTQIVLRSSENNNIISFTQCGSKGTYILEVDEPGNYYLEFNILSYKSRVYQIVLKPEYKDSTIEQNAMLEFKPITFEEIIIKAEGSIKVRGDTISYKAADFKRGDESVVEDLLKRLPGVNVDEKGVVRFAGKEVEKIMIEGTDLFEKGYTAVTKNMDAVFVDRVEVLQRYSDNTELKGLEHSDKVAMNLTLTEEANTSLFGSTTLGYNTDGNHEARLTLMSLKKKFNHYLFINSNRLGYDPLGDVSHFLLFEDKQQQNSSLIDIKPSPFVNIQDENSGLDEPRIRFNDSHLLSYNFIYHPNEKFELKAISFGKAEDDQFNKKGYYTYSVDKDTNGFQKNYSLNKEIIDGFVRVESNYIFSKTSRFTYDGLIYNSRSDAQTNINLINSATNELNTNNVLNTFHLFNYVNRLNKKTAFIVSGNFGIQNISENLEANPFLYEELFLNKRMTLKGYQNIITKHQTVDVRAKLITRLNQNLLIEIKTSTDYLNLKNKSELQFEGLADNNEMLAVSNSDLSNDLSFKGHSSQIGFSGRYGSNEIAIVGTADLHYLSYPIKNEKKDQFFVEPKIGFEWKFSRKNHLQGYYLYDASNSSVIDMTDGYLFTSNRTFERGFDSFEIYRGHNFLVKYRFGEWINRFLIHSMIIYNRKSEYSATDAIITPSYVTYNAIPHNTYNNINVSLNSDIYFPKLRKNLKINGVFSLYSSNGNKINNSLINIRQSDTRLGLKFKSVYNGVFNFTFGHSRVSHIIYSNTRNKNIDYIQFMDVYFDFGKKVKIKLITERYHFGGLQSGNDNYFIDIFVNYIIKPNKWKLKFNGRNLLNNNNFRKYWITNYGTKSIDQDIVSRYFFLSLYYRI